MLRLTRETDMSYFLLKHMPPTVMNYLLLKHSQVTTKTSSLSSNALIETQRSTWGSPEAKIISILLQSTTVTTKKIEEYY